jgi:ribonucleotide monophosphatase NagD (HAD superfamily)
MRDVAMVGDDPKADIAAARRVGLRGILVLSGKVDAEAAAATGVRPTAVAANLLEISHALPHG